MRKDEARGARRKKASCSQNRRKEPEWITAAGGRLCLRAQRKMMGKKAGSPLLCQSIEWIEVRLTHPQSAAPPHAGSSSKYCLLLVGIQMCFSFAGLGIWGFDWVYELKGVVSR